MEDAVSEDLGRVLCGCGFACLLIGRGKGDGFGVVYEMEIRGRCM